VDAAVAFRLPFGSGFVEWEAPPDAEVTTLMPRLVPGVSDELNAVEAALDGPLGGRRIEDFGGAASAAIAIPDHTRPLPYERLLPPLLRRLAWLGVPPERTILLVGTGLHRPVRPDEFPRLVGADIAARYPMAAHDATDLRGLVSFGTTNRGTPVLVNRRYSEADLRLVVGTIDPHQFVGFTGGAKGAVIGLGGAATIRANHQLMSDPGAQLGRYEGNPVRADVDEIGDRVRVDFALNVILNSAGTIVCALAGEPRLVATEGARRSAEIATVAVDALADVAIASPGGHPRDVDLYQAQKAAAHASRAVRPGGAIILVAACPEGLGEERFAELMRACTSPQEIVERFQRSGFEVGPHKAFLFARTMLQAEIYLVSGGIAPSLSRSMGFLPAASVGEAVDAIRADRGHLGRIVVIPRASSTIPVDLTR
jgi:lactate racemase